MIRLTCPECQSRCRINRDRLTDITSHGRCPQCGHRFPLPPSVGKIDNEQNEFENINGTQEKNFSEILKVFIRKKIPGLIKNPFFIAPAGIGLALILLIIFISSDRPEPPLAKESRKSVSTVKTQTIPAPQTKTAIVEVEEFRLDPQIRTRAITQIKHHALVADADIILDDQQLQLALLVAGNTPPSYSERLGCQFAHYIKELIPKGRPQPSFLVSVYYPDGTRLEVPICDQPFEEEIILEMKSKE